MKLLMVFILVAVGLFPSLGFTGIASDIRIQYTHVHGHHENHDHEAEEATQNESDSHTENHTHELVISSVLSTFIETRSHLIFTLGLLLKHFPDAKEEKLPLSNYLNTIFRPPISA